MSPFELSFIFYSIYVLLMGVVLGRANCSCSADQKPISSRRSKSGPRTH